MNVQISMFAESSSFSVVSVAELSSFVAESVRKPHWIWANPFLTQQPHWIYTETWRLRKDSFKIPISEIDLFMHWR